MADSGNEFLDKLLQQTPPAASQPQRGQNYNYPQRLFLKPDGSVVSLQGDPQNRAYYADKGYRELRDTPGRDGGKSELAQYLQDEYPKILKEQREKAAIVNAIRRFGERHRDYAVQDTFDDYSIAELREYLAEIKEDTGADIRVIVPKRERVAQEAADHRLLSGVETSETESLERIQGMLQGTGHDPIEQARRRAGRPQPVGA